MEKVAQIESASLFVRKGDPLTQESMDYMATHKVYLDGRASDHIMCLLPRVHNMYFELRLEEENPRRIGFVNNYVDCSNGLEAGISSYVEKVLAPKIQKKRAIYKSLCQ